MNLDTQIATITLEYDKVKEEIKNSSKLLREALDVIQDNKDKITNLTAKLSDLQTQYFDLVKQKEAINHENETQKK